MKRFLVYLWYVSLVALFVIGFIFLMDKAIFDPIEVNAEHPAYSVRWISAWTVYTVISFAFYLTLGTRHE